MKLDCGSGRLSFGGTLTLASGIRGCQVLGGSESSESRGSCRLLQSTFGGLRMLVEGGMDPVQKYTRLNTLFS